MKLRNYQNSFTLFQVSLNFKIVTHEGLFRNLKLDLFIIDWNESSQTSWSVLFFVISCNFFPPCFKVNASFPKVTSCILFSEINLCNGWSRASLCESCVHTDWLMIWKMLLWQVVNLSENAIDYHSLASKRMDLTYSLSTRLPTLRLHEIPKVNKGRFNIDSQDLKQLACYYLKTLLYVTILFTASKIRRWWTGVKRNTDK